MITFNQKTDPYRPLNRVKEIQQVDIVKTLEVSLTIFICLEFYIR